MRISANRLMQAFTALSCLSLPYQLHAELNLVEPQSSEDWVSVTTKLKFTIDGSESASSTDKYAIFIGNTDVTSLFHQTSSGEFQYSSSVFPIPSGEAELKVYRISNNNWEEVGRSTLRVLTPGGFETSSVQPRLDVSLDSQIDEGHSDDAGEPERETYTDLSMNAGLSIETRKNDFAVRSNANVVGYSEREQALRFSEKGQKASKVDLSDYLVEIEKGNTNITIGHASFGQNPLLVEGISNRGLTFKHKFSDSLDFELAVKNGTSIVGFSNLLGVRTLDHNISGGTIGYEIVPKRPGALRMELAYVSAKIQSLTNFDVGEVPDAEKSTGYGIRLLGSTESGRVRGELNYARSSYTNPDDPFLSQGFNDVVAVEETTNSARQLMLNFDLFSDYTLGESTPFNLSMALMHQRIDPLYKTLAAFPNADILQNQIEITSQIGGASFLLQHTWFEDNLDDIPSILKTKTRAAIFNAAYDFSTLSNNENGFSLWPSANLSLNRTRQYAANNPDAGISGFNGGSHLPDQTDVAGDLGLSWGFDAWNLNYTYSYSHQDNLQVGREDDDFKTNGHQLSIDYQFTDNLQAGFSLGKVRSENIAEALKNTSETFGVNFSWQIKEKWAVSGSFDKALDTDSENFAKNDAINADLQLTRQFAVPFPDGSKRNGQFYLRYNRSETDTKDNLFNFNSFVKNWTVIAGLSFSFY